MKLLDEVFIPISERRSREPGSASRFKCEICKEGFASRAGLKMHMRHKHSGQWLSASIIKLLGRK